MNGGWSAQATTAVPPVLFCTSRSLSTAYESPGARAHPSSGMARRVHDHAERLRLVVFPFFFPRMLMPGTSPDLLVEFGDASNIQSMSCERSALSDVSHRESRHE